MIEQTNVFACRQLITFISIAGNSLILYKLVIYNSFVLCSILLTTCSYFCVLIIRTICQTQLPVLISLIQHRLYHLIQELQWGIIQRHKNADLHHAVKLRITLSCSLLWCRKACCSVEFSSLLLSFLLPKLSGNSLRTSQITEPAIIAQSPVHRLTQRFACFPHRVILDSVQLELQRICFILGICQSSCQRSTSCLFLFVCFLIVRSLLLGRIVFFFHDLLILLLPASVPIYL